MKKIILTLGVAVLLVAPAAYANNGSQTMKHGHDMHNSMDKINDGGKKEMFLARKEIDGYTVSFHAMKAGADKAHGGSHNLMVKVEKNGNAQTNIALNSKVIHPNGKEESKPLMKMGDWYMAGYDLGHEGKHQLMVLFKTSDGAKHFGGVTYP